MAESKSLGAKKTTKKVQSMRDKSVTNTKIGSRDRIKSGARKVTVPFVAAKRISKKEYFVVKPREAGFKGFLTKSRRWTPGYFRSAYAELRQVTWPSRSETWRLVTAVFIFSVAFGLVITIVDFGLEKLFRKAFL